jgi:hypothetical protein
LIFPSAAKTLPGKIASVIALKRLNLGTLIHRRREHCQRCLKPDTEEWNYILEHLQKYWSPEAICGCWALEHPEAKPLAGRLPVPAPVQSFRFSVPP